MHSVCIRSPLNHRGASDSSRLEERLPVTAYPTCSPCSRNYSCLLYWNLGILNNKFNTEKLSRCPRASLKSLSWYQGSAWSCWSLFPALFPTWRFLVGALKRKQRRSQTDREVVAAFNHAASFPGRFLYLVVVLNVSGIWEAVTIWLNCCFKCRKVHLFLLKYIIGNTTESVTQL